MKFIKRAKEMAKHPLMKVDLAKPGSDKTVYGVQVEDGSAPSDYIASWYAKNGVQHAEVVSTPQQGKSLSQPELGFKADMALKQIAKDGLWGPFSKDTVMEAFAATTPEPKFDPLVGPSSYLFNKISDVVYLKQIKDVIHYETEYDIEHMNHKVLINFMQNGVQHGYTIVIPVYVVQDCGGEAKLNEAMDAVLGPLKKSKQKSYATIPASAISAGSVSAASIAMPKPDPVKILDAIKQMTTSEKKELAQLIAPFLQTEPSYSQQPLQHSDLQMLEAYFASKLGAVEYLPSHNPFKHMPPNEWDVQTMLGSKTSLPPLMIKVKQS